MNPSAAKIREAAKFASVTSAEQDTLRTAALLLADLLEGGTLVKFDRILNVGLAQSQDLDEGEIRPVT